MNIVHKIITSTAFLGMLNISALPMQGVLPINPAGSAVVEAEESIVKDTVLAEYFLGDAPASEKKAIISDQMEFVSTRGAYPASLAVIEKHAEAIKETAKEKNVPEDVAIGVALLENGGSETAVSSAGAAGVYQLMPYTARSLGLTVSKKVDERMNPAKSIEAGITYLRSNFDRFGDWGLATWAYHAGEGNVTKAVKLYAQANHGVKLKGLSDPDEMRSYVLRYELTVHKLLSDPAVKNFTKKLNDDSAGYPYKVVATSQLFRDANR
jgi:soluble lytic murein transglycosylase-like protein